MEEDVPRPGPGEVRVKVLVAGVSFTDAQLRAGTYIGVRPVARACIPLVAILVLSNTNAAHNFWYAPYLGAAAKTAGGRWRAAG